MTLFLIDANVLIRAHADYYSIERFGPFWDWLLMMAEGGQAKVPREVYDEVAGSPDLLGQWLKRSDVRKAMILAEATNGVLVNFVITSGYAADLDDIELETIGCDPFLVAAALNGTGRVVVTREVSKPSKLRANRKVPDVCSRLGLSSIDDFELWRRLDFRIA